MNDDLFYLFGIGHLLSRLSLEKQDGGLGFASNLLTCPLVHLSTYHVTLSLIQATCSLIYSLTCPLTMLPIEVSKSHDKDKN